jgi:hypothetical protein
MAAAVVAAVVTRAFERIEEDTVVPFHWHGRGLEAMRRRLLVALLLSSGVPGDCLRGRLCRTPDQRKRGFSGHQGAWHLGARHPVDTLDPEVLGVEIARGLMVEVPHPLMLQWQDCLVPSLHRKGQ